MAAKDARSPPSSNDILKQFVRDNFHKATAYNERDAVKHWLLKREVEISSFKFTAFERRFAYFKTVCSQFTCVSTFPLGNASKFCLFLSDYGCLNREHEAMEERPAMYISHVILLLPGDWLKFFFFQSRHLDGKGSLALN